jgi:hypothetical protein
MSKVDASTTDNINSCLRKLSNDEQRIARIAKMNDAEIAEALLAMTYLQDKAHELKTTGAAKKGKEGEQQIASYLEMCGYKPTDISRTNSKKGDIEVMLGCGRVVFEVKNYKSTVPSAQLQAFFDGLPDRGTDVAAGVFISLASKITGMKNGDIEIRDIVLNNGKNVPIYILTQPLLQTIEATMKSIEYFCAAAMTSSSSAVTVEKKDDAAVQVSAKVIVGAAVVQKNNNNELVSTNMKLVNERLTKVAETILALQFDIGKLHTSIFT